MQIIHRICAYEQKLKKKAFRHESTPRRHRSEKMISERQIKVAAPTWAGEKELERNGTGNAFFVCVSVLVGEGGGLRGNSVPEDRPPPLPGSNWLTGTTEKHWFNSYLKYVRWELLSSMYDRRMCVIWWKLFYNALGIRSCLLQTLFLLRSLWVFMHDNYCVYSKEQNIPSSVSVLPSNDKQIVWILIV